MTTPGIWGSLRRRSSDRSGERRIASHAILDAPGGTVRVYRLLGSAFADPEVSDLVIRGTVPDPLGGIAVGEEPAAWLAVATMATELGPMTLGLFDPAATGSLSIDDAPAMVLSNNEHFSTGQWMKGVGDRDGDGVAELGIGAPAGVGAADPVGRAYILTPGQDPVLEDALETWVGQAYEQLTGSRVRGGADLDGDGLPEIAVGSPYDNEAAGRVDVASWLGPGTHDLMSESFATVLGENPNDFASDAALVDADLDGVGDLVVAMAADTWVDSPGKVLLFHGPISGTLERQDASRVWVGSEPGSRFGYDMISADVDGNGTPDLVVGAPWQDVGANANGAVHFIYDFGL